MCKCNRLTWDRKKENYSFIPSSRFCENRYDSSTSTEGIQNSQEVGGWKNSKQSSCC